jgi:hypothetical protein
MGVWLVMEGTVAQNKVIAQEFQQVKFLFAACTPSKHLLDRSLNANHLRSTIFEA